MEEIKELLNTSFIVAIIVSCGCVIDFMLGVWRYLRGKVARKDITSYLIGFLVGSIFMLAVMLAALVWPVLNAINENVIPLGPQFLTHPL